KDAAAMASIELFFKAREPMRMTACTTIASTAALSPKNNASTGPTMVLQRAFHTLSLPRHHPLHLA
ncbi:MAG: hypothetical protein QF541_08510, partial [Lentisphaeria bacterium]|nr:hypothetical protein [Lentisphaeria bacterium]